MKVLNPNFKIPENPCNKYLECKGCSENPLEQNKCHKYLHWDGQQSILSQLKEVDISQAYKDYRYNYLPEAPFKATKSFEEFVISKLGGK